LAADDQQLVKACLRGNPRAQPQLYEQHKLPLFRLCLRYARDHQEAEDFLHDAFLVIFRDLGQFRGTGPLGGWLRRLTINVALQQLRQQRRLLFPETDLEQAADVAAEEEELPLLPDLSQIIAYIQALPAGYRAVFNLFVVEGFSHQDIADQLGISVGASKSQLSKAKAMLRGRLHSKTAVS
jgi:RNA polymerase sigma-70 factor, ECF subfamily